MFKQQTVTNCPVTSGTFGRIVMPTELIAELVGALADEPGQEWLVFMHGRREKGGLVYVVDRFSVPQKQRRHSSEVDIPQMAYDDDLIGPIHSHHSMGAFMSGTDKTKLNPRFDISIVISSRLDNDEAEVLGFSYEAVGHAKLPCGANGHIRYVIQPEGVEDWPFYLPPDEFERDTEMKGLGDCCKAKVEKVEEEVFYETITVTPTCDLGVPPVTVNGPKQAVFGFRSKAISKLLPPPVSLWPTGIKSEGVTVKDRRRLRQGDAENYYGHFYSDVEWDKGEIDTRQECSWCKSWEASSELIEFQDEMYCDDCFDYMFELVSKGEESILAAGYEEDVLWEGREVELAAKIWGGHYDG